MTTQWRLHLAFRIDQLPDESPLQKWLTTAIAAHRVVIVHRDDPLCELSLARLPDDTPSVDPALSWQIAATGDSPFQLAIPDNTPPGALDAFAAALIEIGRLRRELSTIRQALHESNAAEQAARITAATDFLTGLPSRLDWEVRFAKEIRFPSSWAVMVLDLDELGRLNRAGGMEAGDRWLRIVGKRLRAAAAPHQTLARWGGDEFIVAWPTDSQALARHEAERLYSVIADADIAAADIADAGIADAGIADADIADADIAGAGIAGAGIAGAGIADAGIADAGIADAGIADAGIADAGSAGAVSADADRDVNRKRALSLRSPTHRVFLSDGSSRMTASAGWTWGTVTSHRDQSHRDEAHRDESFHDEIHRVRSQLDRCHRDGANSDSSADAERSMDGNSDGSSESAAGKDADQLGIPIEPDACALRIGRHPLYRLIRAAENALFRAKDRGGRQIVEAS